eukprot:TRINITY_DN6682_c1_g1_i1.p1 TRINITY_DN6682_c1_g1~~TRINITY_DN6682_c1_g1_i1.p1  ORF type:complete len:158 (-),score=40.72 TRINITY_DN6682_c1_g1_i1:17-490(-)
MSEKEFIEADSLLHDRMVYFHDHFRSSFASIENKARKMKTTKDIQIISSLVSQFNHHLHAHHSIEEAHIFPSLAQKMPEFQKKGKLPDDHKAIHDVMAELSTFVVNLTVDKKDELILLLEKVNTTVFSHLTAEEASIKGENLLKYFTLAELRVILSH